MIHAPRPVGYVTSLELITKSLDIFLINPEHFIAQFRSIVVAIAFSFGTHILGRDSVALDIQTLADLAKIIGKGFHTADVIQMRHINQFALQPEMAVASFDVPGGDKFNEVGELLHFFVLGDVVLRSADTDKRSAAA